MVAPAVAGLGVLGAGISAAAPVVSDWMNYSLDKKMMYKQFDMNYAMQKEFAQNALLWRINQLKKAGINPLAGLGASTSSPAGVVSSPRANFNLSHLSNLVQYMSPYERKKRELDLRKDELEIKKMEKDLGTSVEDIPTDNIGRQIKQVEVKMGGEKTANYVIPERESMRPSGLAGGFQAMFSYYPDDEGWYQIQMTQNVSEVFESAPIPTRAVEFFRDLNKRTNQIISYKAPQSKEASLARALIRKLIPSESPGPGMEWRYHPWRHAFKPFPKKNCLYWDCKSGFKQR